MSDSVRPHRWQPTRLPCPWGSPGKNTGVGCHFFLQRMKVKSESEVAQSCPTLSDPMDCSLPGSSVHGIFQAKYWSGLPLPSPEWLPYMHAKSLKSCPTLCDPMDCSPPISSIHGVLQARILEWVAIFLFRGSSQPRDRTCLSHSSCIAGRFFTSEPPGKPRMVVTR